MRQDYTPSINASSCPRDEQVRSRRAFRAPRVLGALMAAGLVGVAASATLAQTITVIPPITGGSISRATGVNATGTAVAGYGDDAGGNDRAIRWTLSGGTQNLGLLPGGSINSYAQGINNDGTVLVGFGDSGGITRGFKWTQSGGYQILLFPNGSPITNYNTAKAVSGDGQIIAGTWGLGANADGCTWDPVNAPFGAFSVCAGAGAGNAGLAVSNDGLTIVGTCGTSAVLRQYFPSNILATITGFPGQQWQMAEAVSANGAFITGRYSPSTGGEFGYRYGLTVPGFVQALPLTPNGATALRPRAISGDGNTIVGQVVDNVAGFTGFAWSPAIGSVLISNYLQGRGVPASSLTGWTFTDVTGISVDGKSICGNGNFGGVPRGWVARNLACPSITAAISEVAGCVGGTAQLQTFVASPPPGVTLTYRWYKNGVLIVNGVQPSGSSMSGANTANLTISVLQPGDAGSYQVGVSAMGACETLSSPYAFAGPATLTVVNQPTNTTACLAQNPFLFAAATFPSGGVIQKWQKLVALPNTWAFVNDGPTGNGSTYLGTATTTFSIINAQGADSGTYRSVFNVTGCSLATQVISNAVTLTVIDSLPAILGPYDTAGCPGDNDVQLSVTVNPCVNCTYQWQRYDPCPFVNCFTNISDGPTGNGGNYGGTNTPTLTIAGLYPGDFTQYRCRINMPCAGNVFSSEATVSASPAPTIIGPTVTSACLGALASMNVAATPAGSTYQWQKYVGPCVLCYQNITNGPTGNGSTFSGAQTPTLNITNLNILDTVTTYRCLVTEPCGVTTAASADAGLAPQTAPAIQTQPVGGPICPNGTRQLTVTLAPGNYGPVTFQWFRYVPIFPIYQPVSNGTYPSGTVYAGAQTATLTVSNFNQPDAGQYYCMVSGACSNTPSAVVNLVYCPADKDCSGAVDVADIFAFLSQWFAMDPAADADGNTLIEVADIFAFLSQWFTGC